jgi:hypothetical protein
MRTLTRAGPSKFIASSMAPLHRAGALAADDRILAAWALLPRVLKITAPRHVRRELLTIPERAVTLVLTSSQSPS